MRATTASRLFLLFGAAAAVILTGCQNQAAPTRSTSGVGNANAATAAKSNVEILNVSYDPTRELYKDFNQAFAAHWKQQQGGQQVSVKQSHGGSGKQARSVIDGLEADVVTLGLGYDVDAIANAGLAGKDWQNRLPDNASPYTSTLVFLVRKGNPKNIKTWEDIVRPGVSVVTSNPKTSAGGRWAYLAAYGYALRKNNNDEAKARQFITNLYKSVPVLDTGARGSTTTFVERGIGDVLLAWENEAFLATKDVGAGKFEMIVPSQSILAEPPAAVVDKNVDKHGTRAVAEAYLKYLYTPEGQRIAARHYYRPRLKEVAAENAAVFPKINTFTVADVCGDWTTCQNTHFADGGVFDQIYSGGR